MSLHSLPPELIHRICTWCDLFQIRALRLTSRNISAIADEYLLDEVYTFFDATSLSKLDDIARSAISIRKGIKSFCFQADGLEHETFAQWDVQRDIRATANNTRMQMLLNVRTGYPSSSWIEEKTSQILPLQRALLSLPQQPPYSPEQLETIMIHYKAFKQAVNQQHIMQERGTIRSTLTRLFKASPNLSTIQVNAGSTLRPSQALLHKPFQNTLVIPHERRNLAEHVLLATLLAATDASLKIRRLDVGAVEHTFLNEILTSPEDIQRCFSLLRGVENLNWIFLSPKTQESRDLEFDRTLRSAQETFAKFLQMFESVRRLHVLLPDPVLPHGSADLTKAMQNCYWPDLTSLWIGNFQTSGDDLTAMLLRHTSTLRSLKVSAVHLKRGSNWPQCFKAIAGKFTHLLEVTLMGSLTSEDDATDGTYKYDFDSWRGPDNPSDAMKQYILEGGTGDLPIEPRLVLPGGEFDDNWLYESDSEGESDFEEEDFDFDSEDDDEDEANETDREDDGDSD